MDLERVSKTILSGTLFAGLALAACSSDAGSDSGFAGDDDTGEVGAGPGPGASASASSGGDLLDPDAGPAPSEGPAGCTTDADCDDQDPCTADTCAVSGGGELATGTCSSVVQAGGACLPPPVEQCPVGCAVNQQNKVYPDPVPLPAPPLPAACSGGFELNNPPGSTYTLHASSAAGSEARTLFIDVATYLAPDHIRIVADDGTPTALPILDTCSLQTADYADPTDGCTRPPDETIRRWSVSIPAGTKTLTVDVDGACTPIYLRVLGLCDFDVVPFFAGCRFRELL